MKKLLIAACVLAASCIMASGCTLLGTESESQSSVETKLSAPVELKMNNKGVLSWDDVEGATAYEIVIGDQVKTVEDNKQDLFALVTSAGDYTVSVSAVGGEAATYQFKAVQLSAPSTPVIVEDPETHAIKFVWEGAENTRSYLQQVNDGNWVSNTESYYEISSTGSYAISVKAKGYAANNVLYLESPATAVSETYDHKQGPVLQLLGMEVINWTVEDDVVFDSYNLWVNGVKVKENVECGEEGYDIVANSAVTKTGEYNIQLEAIDNGYSYWSNMLVEVGTYNINENEIYSFDNRIANFPVKKDGISVSNEQYHGESGHSLRYEATKAEQINLVRYAREGHANDISYKTIKKVSYWVYIEPIEGFEGQFPASDLPAVKWEKQWGDGSYKVASFVATQDVPFGEWTKVEIDNIENAYGNILILQYTWQLGQDYVIYIDDITFDEIWEEVEVADAEYEVKYTASASRIGSWQAYESTELSFGEENANTMLTVTMDVCGNAPTTLENSRFGIFNDMAANVNVTENYQFIWIDAAKISSLDTWNTITIQLKTNDEGKCYLAGVYDQADGKIDPYSIFIKNVQIAASVIDGEEAPAGSFKTGESSGYRQAFVGIATPDYEVGTLVNVEMNVYVTGEFDAYTYISWVDTVWTTEGGEVNAEYKVMEGDAMTENLGKWVHLSFFAKVREYDVLRLNAGYPTVDVSATEKGIYLMAANFTSEKSFNYKNVTITATNATVGKAVPEGTQKTTNANGYYQAFVGIPVAFEAGTTVKVSMEVYVTGSYDEYSDGIRWVDTVWTTEGGEVNVATKIVDVAKMNENKGQWFTVEFEATVRNFAVLRANTAYATIDTSSYGNAVYLFAKDFKSAESFNYKNVTIVNESDTSDGEAMPNGMKSTKNQYYQSFAALKTDLEVGTTVTVSMDIKVTGSHDQWGGEIKWVGSVWSTAGGEVNSEPVILDARTLTADEEGTWVHVEFEATVCSFDVLRANNQQFDIMDVDDGPAVYLFAKNFTSAASFSYKNVVITAN